MTELEMLKFKAGLYDKFLKAEMFVIDKAEYNALEKDAGRYRYLRKFAGGVTIVEHPIDEKIAANRDEILDAQIAKKKGIIF